MTKAEFLELMAGEQRWILLRCLRMVAMALIIPGWMSKDRAEKSEMTGAQFDVVVDAAAAQEKTEEGPC